MPQPTRIEKKLKQLALGEGGDSPCELAFPITEMPDGLSRAEDWDEIPTAGLEQDSNWDRSGD